MANNLRPNNKQLYISVFEEEKEKHLADVCQSDRVTPGFLFRVVFPLESDLSPTIASMIQQRILLIDEPSFSLRIF